MNMIHRVQVLVPVETVQCACIGADSYRVLARLRMSSPLIRGAKICDMRL